MDLNSPEAIKGLAARIRARMLELNENPSSASKKTGRGRDVVRNILRAADENRPYNPRVDTIEALARVLQVSWQWLALGEGDKPPIEGDELKPAYINWGSDPSHHVLRIAGIVEAGAFRPVDLEPDLARTVALSPDQRFPKAQQYAWEVRGDSMNLAGIEPGMFVIGVDFFDYTRHYGGVRDGQLVVVQVTRNDGAERELTIKELRIFEDRMELTPRSSNPKHSPMVLPRTQSAADFPDEISIVALVLHAHRIFV